MSFIGLAPRAKYKKEVPKRASGVLIREPAICSTCGGKCKISIYYGVTEDGYYTYYNDKLCKICAKKQGIV